MSEPTDFIARRSELAYAAARICSVRCARREIFETMTKTAMRLAAGVTAPNRSLSSLETMACSICGQTWLEAR